LLERNSSQIKYSSYNFPPDEDDCEIRGSKKDISISHLKNKKEDNCKSHLIKVYS